MTKATRDDLLETLVQTLKSVEGFSAFRPNLYHSPGYSLAFGYKGKDFTLLIRARDEPKQRDYTHKRDKLRAHFRDKYKEEYNSYVSHARRTLNLRGTKPHNYARTELQRAHAAEWKELVESTIPQSSSNSYNAFRELKARHESHFQAIYQLELALHPNLHRRKSWNIAKHKFIAEYREEYDGLLYKKQVDKAVGNRLTAL